MYSEGSLLSKFVKISEEMYSEGTLLSEFVKKLRDVKISEKIYSEAIFFKQNT